MKELEKINETEVQDITGGEVLLDEINRLYSHFSPTTIASYFGKSTNVAGPHSVFFGATRINSSDFKLLKASLKTVHNEPVKIDITAEALDDIKKGYSKDPNKFIAGILKGAANEDENTKFIKFLNTEAAQWMEPVSLSDNSNAKIIAEELTQRIFEIASKINSKNFRSYNITAIIPQYLAGSILYFKNTGERIDSEQLKDKQVTLDIIINTDVNDNNMYVGFKDKVDDSKSSVIHGKYYSKIKKVLDTDDGEPRFFIFDSFGFALNPTHSENPVLYKVEIQ